MGAVGPKLEHWPGMSGHGVRPGLAVECPLGRNSTRPMAQLGAVGGCPAGYTINETHLDEPPCMQANAVYK